MSIDDETLFAFADGELAPDEARRIEAAAAGDPALAGRIERARQLRRALADAYDDTLAEHPPARLTEAVARGAAAQVIDLAAARARRAPPRARPAALRWGAVAASLVVAFVAGRLFEAPGPIAVGPSGGLVASGALAGALDQGLASAQGPDAPVKIGVSFQALDGRYCRTFLTRAPKPLGGLACRDPQGWQVKMAVAAEPQAAPAGGYATAAAAMPTQVLEAVDASIKGAPLDAVAEKRARDAGWR